MSTDDIASNSLSSRLKSNLQFVNGRLKKRQSEHDAFSDVKALAQVWIKLASYDFIALGLDNDHPAVAELGTNSSSESMWKIGRQIVAGIDKPNTDSAIRSLFDAIMLERVVLHFLPSEKIKLRADSIKNRFQATVGKERYELYFPVTTLDKPLSPEELRDELDFILTETMYVYMLTPLRPQARSRILWYCMKPFFLISATMLLISVTVALNDQRLDQFATLALIPVFGSMGAMLSFQQRVENLPSAGDTVRNTLAMESGRQTLWTTSVAGSIFAIVINLLFAGGMIEGNLFPKFGYLRGILPTQQDPGPLADIAKMLIWAFVAGFAERLVPDTIGRLTTVLKSNDFGANSKIPGRKLQENEQDVKPVASPTNPEDVYSDIMKAQADLEKVGLTQPPTPPVLAPVSAPTANVTTPTGAVPTDKSSPIPPVAPKL